MTFEGIPFVHQGGGLYAYDVNPGSLSNILATQTGTLVINYSGAVPTVDRVTMSGANACDSSPGESLGKLLSTPILHTVHTHTHHLSYFNGATHAGSLMIRPFEEK